MAPGLDDVAPSPGGESVVSSKRGASPDDGGNGAESESTSAGAAARKKKKLGPGSRGVANLTPEQLEKKRANDRVAQRAIRERTKNQIDALEQRIRDLTSQQPYQELQAVIKAKEAVERENTDIKRRLAALIGELQPLIGSDAERAYVSPSRTFTPAVLNSGPPPPPAPLSVHNASTPGSTTSPGSLEMSSTHSWQGGPGGATVGGSHGEQAMVQLSQQRHDLQHGLDMGPERLGLDFLLDPNQRIPRITNGNSAQDTPRHHHVPMKHDWTGVRHDQALRVRSGGGAAEAAILTSWESQLSKPEGNTQQSPSPAQQQQQQEQGFGQGTTTGVQSGFGGGVAVVTRPGPRTAAASATVPENASSPEVARHEMPILNCPPTCPLDSLLLDFLTERRQRAAEGLPTQEVVGPRYPSVSSLLNPSHSVYSHPLSKVFTDILSTFPDLSALPERVGVLYIMFLIMRWQISPTLENYERLPEWVRPLPSQLAISHPAWSDHIPFVKMRDKIVREGKHDDFPFDNFFIPFTTTLSLNWPYEGTDTLLRNPQSDELLINPVFERHLRNPNNWSLGEEFAQAFPSLAGTYNYCAKKRGHSKQQ